LILFHCTSTFPRSHLIAPSFSSSLSCTFCRWACNFSKSHLGLRFWTLWFSSIWCRSLQPGSCGQSQYLLQAVPTHPSHCSWIAVSLDHIDI
jgi:hypothetical protein